MVTFKILDTGYVSTKVAIGSQTQLGVTLRAGYTGSTVAALPFLLQNHSLSGGTNTEQKPIINTFTDAESNTVSVNNRELNVSGILKKEILTSGYNKNNVVQFLRLERTLGLKLIYPTASDSILPTVIEALGAENLSSGFFSSASPSEPNGTVSTSIPYLIGRITNITINDTEDGKYWRIGFRFIISG